MQEGSVLDSDSAASDIGDPPSLVAEDDLLPAAEAPGGPEGGTAVISFDGRVWVQVMDDPFAWDGSGDAPDDVGDAEAVPPFSANGHLGPRPLPTGVDELQAEAERQASERQSEADAECQAEAAHQADA